jgi:flagellar hook-associated protein 3 FlgL
MRVTQNSSANNALYNIQQQRTRLDNLQESISTGQKINRPSDNPISTGTLLDLGDRLNAIDQYSTNISKANTMVQFTNTALTGMSDILTQAQKLIGTINSGSSDPTARQSAHDQLVDLKKQIVDMANTQLGDQYIFGGANSNVPPFNSANNTYAGDSTQLTIEIASKTTQAVSMTGDRLILGKSTPPGTLPNYGSTDILQTFDNLITAVGDTTTPSNVANLTQGAIDLQAGSTQITNAIGDVINRMTRLDNMNKLNINNKNMMQSIVGNLQNVDYAQLGIELQNQNTALEASLSATAKISQLSLLNYM